MFDPLVSRVAPRRAEVRNNASFGITFYTTCLRGFESMSTEAAERLRCAIPFLQGPGGFFFGRAAQEDLYYTFFGILLAMISQAKIRRNDCRHRVASVDFSTLDLVHRCSLLRTENILKLLALPGFLRNAALFARRPMPSKNELEKLRSLDDLPEALYPQRDKNAPYSRFLAGTLLDDFGQKQTPSNFDDYRLPNGLYANLKNHPAYGVNATGAVLFLLPRDRCKETAESLSMLQESDGSFKAAASAREGDLLSTATAVFSLRYCKKTPLVSIKPYLRNCFRETGLFAATPDDPLGDLEYTVYGLLAMGAID